MKLFLASEIKHPDSMRDLDSFVDGLKGKSIAFIPTAYNGELKFGEWVNSSTLKILKSYGPDITFVQLEDFKNSSVIDELRNKEIIWFAGGYCSYLMYWVIRCEVDLHIRELLNSGSIYVGSSAGAMVASKDILTETWYPGESNRTATYLPGMGLVDFDIFPHYEESMLPDIKLNYKGKKLYLLKNGESVIVDGDSIKTMGVERVLTTLSS